MGIRDGILHRLDGLDVLRRPVDVADPVRIQVRESDVNPRPKVQLEPGIRKFQGRCEVALRLPRVALGIDLDVRELDQGRRTAALYEERAAGRSPMFSCVSPKVSYKDTSCAGEGSSATALERQLSAVMKSFVEAASSARRAR